MFSVVVVVVLRELIARPLLNLADLLLVLIGVPADFARRRLRPEQLTTKPTVAIVGGGFSGLCTGARLKQAGVEGVRIIEGGGDFGGVWYWNRYPGAMCDTAAMIYLPLLEETGYLPTKKYVFAPEIFAHAKRIATTAVCSSSDGRMRGSRRLARPRNVAPSPPWPDPPLA